mgnify:CR=1 FL=1
MGRERFCLIKNIRIEMEKNACLLNYKVKLPDFYVFFVCNEYNLKIGQDFLNVQYIPK